MSRHQTISKEEILTNAMEIIEQKGVGEFSIRHLAEKCNVAASTIYLYYDNKMDLLIQIASDFWNKCLLGFTLDYNGDFFSEMKKLYFHILTYLESFNENWIKVFSLFSGEDKSKGRVAMEGYINRITIVISKLLQTNYSIMDNNLLSECGNEYITNFICKNIVTMWMSFDNNYDKFEIVVKKIIKK